MSAYLRSRHLVAINTSEFNHKCLFKIVCTLSRDELIFLRRLVCRRLSSVQTKQYAVHAVMSLRLQIGIQYTVAEQRGQGGAAAPGRSVMRAQNCSPKNRKINKYFSMFLNNLCPLKILYIYKTGTRLIF